MRRSVPETDTRARVRAANFFALYGLSKKPKHVTAAWDDLAKNVDLSRPLGEDAVHVLGRLDIDAAQLRAFYEAALASFAKLEAHDRVLEWRTAGYPTLLSELADAPRFLFVRMAEQILDAPGLAVVGTRKPTPEGVRRARKLAYLLAKQGITVVSGLARGIDEAAHRGALDVGGRTIAVIGTPLNRVYPKEHADLQRHIGRVGAVVSQFHPGATTTPLAFPLRNATMSGLTLGTVIIEAGETSGALIQAEHCLAQGRKLFIPRSAVENADLKWPKKLLERGAQMFSAIEDLIELLDHENLLTSIQDEHAEQAEVLKLNVAGG